MNPAAAIAADVRFTRLTLACGLLTFAIVLLSAWLRLRASGLGCTDWPACYAAFDATRAAPAWAALVHRALAMLLSVGMLWLGWSAWRQRHACPGRFAAVLIGCALLLGLATLGRFTPAPRLPWVTLANLSGGVALLALLAGIYLRAAAGAVPAADAHLRPWARGALVVTGMQIALGGWVSANYAAAACAGLAGCGAELSPALWTEAFDPLRRLAAEGTALTAGAEARLIHAVHRLGAAVTSLYIGTLALAAVHAGGALRRAGAVLAGTLLLQLGLGVGSVLLGLPLWLATAHNASAALLLLGVVYLNRLLTPEPHNDR